MLSQEVISMQHHELDHNDFLNMDAFFLTSHEDDAEGNTQTELVAARVTCHSRCPYSYRRRALVAGYTAHELRGRRCR